MAPCEDECLPLSRKRVGPFPPRLSQGKLDREKDFLAAAIAIGVEFDDRRGKVIEAQARSISDRQTLDHREEVLKRARTLDQPDAQHLTLPVPQQGAHFQTSVDVQRLIEQHNPGALSCCDVPPGLLNQLRIFGLLQFSVDLCHAWNAGDLYLLFLAIDSPPIDEATAKRIDGYQRSARREIDALGGKPVPKEAGILSVRLVQRQAPGLAQ